MIVLGIESSCDDTAAAVVVDGVDVLSSVVSSQITVHQPYGGVVPELASRKHMEAISTVVNKALEQADIGKEQLDAVAATQGPGLIGALLVGFSFAKAYAFTLGIPGLGVNHLEGHINSVFLGGTPAPRFPFVALLASGGHTGLYHVESHTDVTLMGQTRDDAAGEAFDKVAKMLGLGYPGGGIIDRLAREGDPRKVVFSRPYVDKSGFDFSFSGIKTAVKRYIDVHADSYANHIPDIVAGFQEAVVDVLSYKLIHAAMNKGCEQIAMVGGVAANQRLGARLRQDAAANQMTVHIPPIDLCGDNAAMIASVGYHYLTEGRSSDLSDDVFSKIKLRKNHVHL